MKARLFTVVIGAGSENPITRQLHAKTDNRRDRALGRLLATIGRDVVITYREAGTNNTRTFDRTAIIRRLGGFREYASFIGHPLI